MQLSQLKAKSILTTIIFILAFFIFAISWVYPIFFWIPVNYITFATTKKCGDILDKTLQCDDTTPLFLTFNNASYKKGVFGGYYLRNPLGNDSLIENTFLNSIQYRYVVARRSEDFFLNLFESNQMNHQFNQPLKQELIPSNNNTNNQFNSAPQQRLVPIDPSKQQRLLRANHNYYDSSRMKYRIWCPDGWSVYIDDETYIDEKTNMPRPLRTIFYSPLFTSSNGSP